MTVSSTNGAEKSGYHMYNTETKDMSLTMYYYQFKVDQ
jgi:hypothetical protein